MGSNSLIDRVLSEDVFSVSQGSGLIGSFSNLSKFENTGQFESSRTSLRLGCAATAETKSSGDCESISRVSGSAS